MSNDPGADPDAQPGAPEDPEQAPEAADAPQKRKRPFWRDLVLIVVAALALTIVLKAFVGQAFSSPPGSMENALLINDRILVSRIGSVQRGEVVGFSGAGSWDPATP